MTAAVQNKTGKPFKRILLTGAAGGLGKVLRERIKPWAEVVRLSDVAEMAPAGPGEEVVQCDLADKEAVLALLDGVDAVLHFGGISTEKPFEPIMQANILGVANLYEALHKAGTRRVVFASSNHAIGYHPVTTVLDADSPTRPDSYYGLSKVFGEQIARYYYDRFGIETVCVRIGSSFPEPANKRMMSTYLSYDLVGQPPGLAPGLQAEGQLGEVRPPVPGFVRVPGQGRRDHDVPGRQVPARRSAVLSR
jgi:uronate dehydrogenase